MDTQTAYERIRKFYSKPNTGPGYDLNEGSCAYKVDEKHKCAFGTLITDKLYRDEMEGKVAHQVIETYPNVARMFMDCDIKFLVAAQRLHDDIADECLVDSRGHLIYTDEFEGYVAGIDDEQFKTQFIPRLDQLAKTFSLNVVTT